MPRASLPRHFWVALGLVLGGLLVTAWILLSPDPIVPGSQATALATSLPATVTQAPGRTRTAAPTATSTPLPAPTPRPSDPPPTPAPPGLTPDGVVRTARVPILMYHYVGGLPADADVYRVDLTVTPERFEAQLAYLKRAGYTGITLEDLVRHLATGSRLPPKPIVLTFDDGYADNYLYAFPLLRQYGFRGTFFVVTGFLDEGRGGYMTWEQARLMQENGMDIEPHGVTHEDLRGRSEEFVLQELAGSRRAVEEHLHKPAHLFAYPSGRYDQQVMVVLGKAGYWGAVTTVAGAEHSSDALLELSRVRIHGADELSKFIDTLAYFEP